MKRGRAKALRRPRIPEMRSRDGGKLHEIGNRECERARTRTAKQHVAAHGLARLDVRAVGRDRPNGIDLHRECRLKFRAV